MAYCSVIMMALVAVTVKAALIPVLHHDDYEHHGPAEYHFQYAVHDDHTGDIKSQHEERHGDKVNGQYSLIDADGYRRIVDYSSDKHTGFIAHVQREPLKGHHHVEVVPKKIIPVAKYVKPVAFAPIVVHQEHHLKPVHEHVALHHVAPQLHVVKPAHHVSQHHDAHSHTSFKSGKVSYQY